MTGFPWTGCAVMDVSQAGANQTAFDFHAASVSAGAPPRARMIEEAGSDWRVPIGPIPTGTVLPHVAPSRGGPPARSASQVTLAATSPIGSGLGAFMLLSQRIPAPASDDLAEG